MNGEILLTAGSYAEPAAKAFITAGYSARRGPIGHKPAVIRITAGYLKTIGKGLGGELTFCSSDSLSNMWTPIKLNDVHECKTFHILFIL